MESSKKESSKIKRCLLESGMPLEVSVIKEITKLGIENHGEVEYQRDDKIFSTDILGKRNFNIVGNLDLSVNFVIECKYKTKDHSWFFMKYPTMKYPEETPLFDVFTGEERTEVYNMCYLISLAETLGYMNYGIKELPLYYFTKINLFDFETVNKGIDIIKKKKFDPNTIKKAVYQSIFASIKSHYLSISDNAINYFRIEHSPIFGEFLEPQIEDSGNESILISSLTIPIVLTTAKIFKLREGITLEKIQKKKDVEELYEEKSGVLLSYVDYLDFEKFLGNLTQKYRRSEKVINMMGLKSYCIPGCVYITNYEYLEDTFSHCISKIERLCREYKMLVKKLKKKE